MKIRNVYLPARSAARRGEARRREPGPAGAVPLHQGSRVSLRGLPSTDTLCAGFAARHGDNCTPIQLARRLAAVVSLFVLACAACGGNDAGPTAPTMPTMPTNRAPVAVDQIPDQIVNAGESVILDVAQYFNDPDGDTLTYSATVDSGATVVRVEASTVTVTGQNRGSTRIAVYARDVHGASAAQPFWAYVHFPGEPPYQGTAFIAADFLTPADPTSLQGVTYAGRGERSIFDRRQDGIVTVNAYLFDVHYGRVEIEYQVNPEFGSREAARAEVDTYAGALGRLPAVLLSRVRMMTINAGNERFHAVIADPFAGGGNSPHDGAIVIYTEFAKEIIGDGFLEEVFIHEGAHVSLDGDHANAPGWHAAQEADDGFISTYARDNPDYEDVAESILPYFALRYLPERLSNLDGLKIRATMPNRLVYFDEQGFDMSPYRRAMAAPIRELVPFQPLRPQRWRPFEAPPLRRRTR